MGAFSILCCPILGPVTWFLANNALTSGTIDDPGKANIAKILGIIATVLFVLGIIARFAFGVGTVPTAPIVPVQ